MPVTADVVGGGKYVLEKAESGANCMAVGGATVETMEAFSPLDGVEEQRARLREKGLQQPAPGYDDVMAREGAPPPQEAVAAVADGPGDTLLADTEDHDDCADGGVCPDITCSLSDNEDDCESNYEWESDGTEPDQSAQGKALAEEQAAVFQRSDGIFAKVQNPHPRMIRVWVSVASWRLYEGLAPRAIEALGLDPKKGVQLMLVTDGLYMSSSVPPEVKWVQQLEDTDIGNDADFSARSRGETFPLQWMLRKRLEEMMFRQWHPSPTDEYDDQEHGVPGKRMRREEDGEDCDSPAMQRAIASICECANVSNELAQYAMRAAKCDQQAQLNLLDDGLRVGLQEAMVDDRLADIAELKSSFPSVPESIIEEAVIANPRSQQRQRAHVCRAEASKDDSPSPPHWSPPSPPPEGTKRRFWWKRRMKPSVKMSAWCGAGSGLEVAMAEEERAERRGLLQDMSESNLLVRVALSVIKKLRSANSNCLVCDDPIRGYLPAVPIVCAKELCVMSSEDMGCGTDVESQVAMKGDTVDLLINMFWMAMRGSRPELGFPDKMEWDGKLAFKYENYTGTSVFGKAGGRGAARASLHMSALNEVLDQLVSVTDMQTCIRRKKEELAGGVSSVFPPSVPDTVGIPAAAHMEASDGVGETEDGAPQTLRQALNDRHQLAYPLLRWLLSANRAHLRPLEADELIPEIRCEKQFMLVTGTAEREVKFQQLKREAAKRGGTGSFYAFHGSKSENWHGILQLGLKNMSATQYMSSGASFGKGIYMADQMTVSLTYASRMSIGAHWPMARTKEKTIIVAVCEVVDREGNTWLQQDSQSFVVPDEECVTTRYLLVNPTSKDVFASKITIKQ